MSKIFNKIIVGILSLGLLIAPSCSSFLSEEIIDNVSVDAIYTTSDGLKAGVNALQGLWREYESGSGGEDNLAKSNWLLIGSTDLSIVRSKINEYVYGDSYTAAGMWDSKWVFGYRIIDRSSAIIENAQKIINMTNKDRRNVIARAKCIRAKIYFDLIRLYENIPLDTIATTEENAFDETEYLPAKSDDIYKLIESDLEFGILNLDWKVQPGEIGQALCRHLRAQVALTRGDWKKAADECDQIISQKSLYDLVPLAEVFGQNVNHSEAIYTVQFDMSLGSNTGNSTAGGARHIYSGLFSSKFYNMNTGKPAELISDVNLGGNVQAWILPNSYLESLYDKEHDKRYTTYFYSKDLVVNNPESPNYGKPLDTDKYPYPDDYMVYHWGLKKYLDLEKPVSTVYSFKDYMLYRLAETYLMGAEAHWRLSNDNYNETALKYINTIRRRAGLTEDYEYIDQDNLLDEYARELCFEKGRWFLLKRMGVLVERVSKYGRLGSNSKNEVAPPIKEYMVNWPIPQTQINMMVGYPQNPGY